VSRLENGFAARVDRLAQSSDPNRPARHQYASLH